MGLHKSGRGRRRVRFNAWVLRHLARRGHRWMAAYMILVPALAFAALLLVLPANLHQALSLLHDGSWADRSDGVIRLIELPLLTVAVGFSLFYFWPKALRDLDERPRRKKLRRDYDKHPLKTDGVQ